MSVEKTILRCLTHINMGATIALLAWVASRMALQGGV